MARQDFEAEAAARLTCHGFILEVILANGFLGMTPAAVDKFVREMKSRSRVSWSRDGEADLNVAARSTELIGQILDAAVERAREGR